MVLYLSSSPRKTTFLRFIHLTTLVVLCLTILSSSYSSSLFVKAEEQQQPCTVTNGTNYFDLSPLKKTDGDDWIVQGYGTHWKFHINICNDILYKGDPNTALDNTGVYGSKNDEGSSLGKTSTTPIVRGDKLLMEFNDGNDKCGTTNYRKSSVISFICDKTVEGQGLPIFVSTFKDCAFFFEWRTPAACSTVKKGIVYNRMVHNASGMRQIPNWEFWCNTWEFLKDIFFIIVAQCPMFQPRRSGGRGYNNLPRDEENVLMEEEFEEH
ncbi:3523_t:CDS:2 [Funneliformis geosporum]|uniref:3523_t:CDS:1 n=1 Tax=Funneliformis geosporum TaxID=1117311 RepID=A0A9W4SNW6_9GLOM|nr:3523_t:CDS:2 [Funneliformis geosporum]